MIILEKSNTPNFKNWNAWNAQKTKNPQATLAEPHPDNTISKGELKNGIAILRKLVNDFPANLSFARAIMKLLQILHVIPIRSNFSNGTINLASAGILLLLVIVIIFHLTRKTSNSILVVPICLLLPVLVPTATFSYYSLVLLPIFAFLFVPHNSVINTSQLVTTSRIDADESVPNWWKWLIILALSLSLAPLPFVGEVRRQRYDTREIARQSFQIENFGIIWTVVVLATLVLIVKNELKHGEVGRSK